MLSSAARTALSRLSRRRDPAAGAAAHRNPPALACVLALGLGLGLGLPPAAAAAELLSHRAAYVLALASSDAAIGLADVHGGLVMEWQSACDGWLSHQRLSFVATTEDGHSFGHDVRFGSWESHDTTRMRFTLRSFDDGRPRDDVRGEAELVAPGGTGVARFVAPDAREMALPAGTLFPTEHIRRVIAGARAGDRLVSHPVFDGSGEDALTRVTAAIGRPLAEDATSQTHWPVSMAYHPIAESEAMPEFEVTFEIADNGVVRALVLDYGDFAIRARLEHLEEIPEPEC